MYIILMMHFSCENNILSRNKSVDGWLYIIYLEFNITTKSVLAQF